MKILPYFGILLCHVFGFNSFSRLPAISHCRETVVRNYMPERIPSLLMEISCERGHAFNSCGRFSQVSFFLSLKIGHSLDSFLIRLQINLLSQTASTNYKNIFIHPSPSSTTHWDKIPIFLLKINFGICGDYIRDICPFQSSFYLTSSTLTFLSSSNLTYLT